MIVTTYHKRETQDLLTVNELTDKRLHGGGEKSLACAPKYFLASRRYVRRLFAASACYI